MSEAAGVPATRRPSAKAQRLRLRFAREPEAAGVGHLDLARVWARAFDEAGLVLSYSEGARQQPRLTFAAGLPAVATSEGELVDAVLAEVAAPSSAAERLRSHLPPGLTPLDAWEVGLGLPSLPSVVRWAEYRLDLPAGVSEAEAAAAVAAFLTLERLDWEEPRGEKVRRYDIRPLAQHIAVERGCEGAARLAMRLRCDSAGVGRPEQVVSALGLPQAARIHRTRLILAEVSPARDAWRRRGRYLA